MKRTTFISCLLIVICNITVSQNFTSSNLPVVIINTDGGVSIPDQFRIPASMKIIYRGTGQRNYLTDQSTPAYLNYNGRIDIEIRGSSSQNKPKKQYGLTTLKADNATNNNVSLMGMPSENDWILNGMVWDPALIRDYLCFNLSRQLGEYASRAVYCEVIINGSYKGLYLLDEKIKADNNRVDVIKITNTDNRLPDLSGGYITKADKTTGNDPIAWTMTSWTGGPVNYMHHLPKPEDVTSAQNTYIKNYFFSLASAAMSGNTGLAYGYPSIIDIPSFIHYMIISELSSNADSYSLSTYFHKDRNGKLRAGPVWDSDLTFGNDLFIYGFDRSKTNVWQFAYGGNDGSRFWRDLYLNNQFRCYFSKRWNELIQPGQPLNQANLEAFIDQTVTWISEAAERDYVKWGISGSYSLYIQELKTWIGARISWITSNIGSFSGCTNIEVPPLVITKIMYNPPESLWFPDGGYLEFIEITNTGHQEVYLSGIYFGGTGLVYLFPYDSTIAPDTSIYLAADTSAFYVKYRFKPFGQYTRHLSNSGQDIVLSDAFGNVIDKVQFSDTIPWPDADGNGYYLKLTDTGLDNNTAGSWIASNDLIMSSENTSYDDGLVLYPNPVYDVLRIITSGEIRSVDLFDLYGRPLRKVSVDCRSFEMNIEDLEKGIYIIRVNVSGRTIIRKIIKY
ncbi:MAG: CotH kinase family protein [Bacteroidia bacterium]|nr:CotH kinase family protein [Bacteroidia bacterium]